MSNPILGLLQSGMLGNNGGNNILGMFQQFMEFKNSFQGNPEEQVKKLMSEGKMSQEQFNQLSSMAKQIEPMLSSFNKTGK